MKKILAALFITVFTANTSFASSLPNGEISQKLSISTGPSFSADFKLSSSTSIGFSVGSPLYRGVFKSGLYDIRLAHNFMEPGKFSLSGIVGLAGNPAFSSGYIGSVLGAEAGIALSYKFLPQLTGRLNIVGTFPIDNFGRVSSNYFNFVAPSSGIELGYKFTNNIEGTIGGNGHGDFLGLNVYF